MYKILKPIFDYIFASIGIIIISPLMLLIPIIIVVDSGFPIFYKQKRVGKNWKIIKLYKFRTMVNKADKLGPLISKDGDSRITNVGKVLRKLKLDELPQLFNVLRGELSIVGPRPEVFNYASIYKEDFTYLLSVKPGITSLASIEYRNENTILANSKNPEQKYINEVLPNKISIDKVYIQRQNIILDFVLIFKTIFHITRGNK